MQIKYVSVMVETRSAPCASELVSELRSAHYPVVDQVDREFRLQLQLTAAT